MSRPESDSVHQTTINISGKKVSLGPLRRDLLPLYQSWINAFETQRTVASIPRPWTLDQESAWFDDRLTAQDVVAFTIYENETARPIGNTNLSSIDYRNGTSEFGLLIGERDCWGKGYGTETARLMLDYAFTALGLNNVMLRVLSYNRAGIHAYQKAGFKEIGRRRQAHVLNRQRWDVILMDCLAHEFDGDVLRQIFKPDIERT